MTIFEINQGILFYLTIMSFNYLYQSLIDYFYDFLIINIKQTYFITENT